jgi:GDPmannose 4,6-dehydratase
LKILIVGANGQDGKHLTNICLKNGNSVVGVIRQNRIQPSSINGCEYLVEDFIDSTNSGIVLDKINPDIIFHVAAKHANSSDMLNFQKNHSAEIFRSSVDISRNILEWQKKNLGSKSVIALSSHMYSGIGTDHLVTESCLPSPLTDYGKAKVETYTLIKEYRRLFNVNSGGAILFNHSSQFGRTDFIFPVLASQISNVVLKKVTEIRLRNFESRIDISDAQEICEAMYKMSQQSLLEDFVLGSGKSWNLRAVTLKVLNHFNVTAEISLISTDKIREPVPVLTSDISKAKISLGWSPQIDPVALLIKLVSQRLSN